MAKIDCDVEYTRLETERGSQIPGVIVRCKGCDGTTESYGVTDASVKRCLVLLKEKCDGKNFYTCEEAGIMGKY
jgi:hypothetical protein